MPSFVAQFNIREPHALKIQERKISDQKHTKLILFIISIKGYVAFLGFEFHLKNLSCQVFITSGVVIRYL